jgi:NAD(P)-dependent dehydrogenase (short-subunit alcohol dehydrogenase family)
MVEQHRSGSDRLFDLSGRTAMVTGGARGIGRGFCHALAASGASVGVVDMELEAAEAVAAEVREYGVDAIAVSANVTVPEDVDRAVRTIHDRIGGPTIGVNNAGVGCWVDSESSTTEEWRRVLSVNLDGVFYCCQAQARIMLEAGYGKIINTASMSGRIVNVPQHQAAYNASKAGVIHLTKSLAAEWASRGVRVNSISPGYTVTPLLAARMETPEGAKAAEYWRGLIPLGRMLEIDDLAAALVFLASPGSDMVTGHDLVVDGGYTII